MLGGIVVIFDHNDSPMGGTDIEVGGDLMVKKNFYPWLSEDFIGDYKRDVSLLGAEVDIALSIESLRRH